MRQVNGWARQWITQPNSHYLSTNCPLTVCKRLFVIIHTTNLAACFYKSKASYSLGCGASCDSSDMLAWKHRYVVCNKAKIILHSVQRAWQYYPGFSYFLNPKSISSYTRFRELTQTEQLPHMLLRWQVQPGPSQTALQQGQPAKQQSHARCQIYDWSNHPLWWKLAPAHRQLQSRRRPGKNVYFEFIDISQFYQFSLVFFPLFIIVQALWVDQSKQQCQQGSTKQQALRLNSCSSQAWTCLAHT